MGFFGAGHGWRAKRPPSLKPVTHILQWWSWYIKKIQKIYKSRDTPLKACSIFYRKSENFVISRNTDIDWILIDINNFFNFVWVLKVCFNKHGCNFDDISKLKVFWKESYDVIISVDNVTNKILSRESNHIVDVVMWPTFDNSRNSIKEVIIASTLYGFDQKIQFLEVLLVQVQ